MLLILMAVILQCSSWRHEKKKMIYKTVEYNKYLRKAEESITWNVVKKNNKDKIYIWTNIVFFVGVTMFQLLCPKPSDISPSRSSLRKYKLNPLFNLRGWIVLISLFMSRDIPSLFKCFCFYWLYTYYLA